MLIARVRLLATLALTIASAVLSACNEEREATAAEGRALYRQNGCGTCHGASGHGDGPVGKTLDPRPRDFRDAAAFKNGLDAAAIAETIATGIPEGGRMPRFSHLTEWERRSLALYVVTLREPSQKVEVNP
jgi:high-affinity iron transporter